MREVPSAGDGGRGLLCAVALWLPVVWTASAADWPQFRGGPARAGAVSADRITTNWSGSVTNPLWFAPFTNSFATFSVSSGRAFTQVNRFNGSTNREVCVAVNITNGTELWSVELEDCHYPVDTGVGINNGPRSTPSVEGDSVFVLTSHLKLYRLDAATGGVAWQKDLLAMYGGVIEENLNAASPLIEGGLIFVNTCAGTTVLGGVGVSNLMAFSTTNGALVWRSQNENMTHSTPVLATIHGTRQVIFATRTGVVSLNPITGALLWKFTYPFTVSMKNEVVVSPVVADDLVFVTGPRGQLMGSVTRRVDYTNGTWSTTQLWARTGATIPSETVASYWMTPVVADGFLYGLFGNAATGTGGENDTGTFKCVNLRTGTIQWSTNNFGRGGTLLVNNHLVILTERGDLVLARPNTNAYTELGRFRAIPGYNASTNKCWNTPAIADGRVYIRSTWFGAVYDLSLPPLKLDLPVARPSGKFELTIRTANGSALDTNRLAGMQIRATTNLALSPPAWPVLTNQRTLTNGVVVITNVDGTPPGQVFIVTEPN